MLKNKKWIWIGAAVLALFAVGVFTFSISTGSFFLTNDYYPTALKAYNADSTYNAVLGDTSATGEVGLVSLDDENSLFIGALDDNRFVVSEMAVKNGKYAQKSTTYFYDLTQDSDGEDSHATAIAGGSARWTILYSEEEANKLSDQGQVKSFSYANGKNIYLVIYAK